MTPISASPLGNCGKPPRPVPGAPLSGFLLAAVLLSVALLASGCREGADKGTVLAQVGESTLTLEELRESFPAEYEQLIRREQYLDFIKRWIDDEVLYQQALKGRLDDDPQVKRKLDKLRRKLLIEEFLARENASEAFEPDEMAMNQFYEMNKDDFRREAPEVKYVHIRLATAKQAKDLRWRLRGDKEFITLAAEHSLDPLPESFAALPFKKQGEIPSCLAADLAATGIGSVAPPVTCPDGVYLVKVLERQEAGTLIPFAEAREEISATLAMQRKDKLLESRVAGYKEGIAISYNLDQIPGLSEDPTEPPPSMTKGGEAGVAPGAGVAAEEAVSPASVAGQPRPAANPVNPIPSQPVPDIIPADPAPARPKPRRKPKPAAEPAEEAPAGGESPAPGAAPVPGASPAPGSESPTSVPGPGSSAPAPAQEESANAQNMQDPAP